MLDVFPVSARAFRQVQTEQDQKLRRNTTAIEIFSPKSQMPIRAAITGWR
jgi:hypothetical protein